MRNTCLIICLMLGCTVSAQIPALLLTDADHLQQLKKGSRATAELPGAISELQKDADSLLSMKPLTVMDKAFTPVSGNKHDYMSQAPYFWYDSTKQNGLPYMRKDGQRNPEIYKITDRTYLGRLENATRILSLAWYFTNDEKYAAKGAELLRTWFLNDATKMNPHLEYAQAIPGVNTGRGIGIIETIALTGIADAASLLRESKSWTAADHQALKNWYSAYLNWLLNSKNGNDEHKAKNNHGTWYYAQVIDFALFTGDKQKARQLAEESRKRLDGQLTPDGKQPLELERTNALGYSTMNLRGWFTVATLAEKAGVDIWNYKTPQGAGLNTALDWLAPYAMGEKTWEYQQISKYNKNEIYPLLLQAALHYKTNSSYPMYASRLDEENKNTMTYLLYRK